MSAKSHQLPAALAALVFAVGLAGPAKAGEEQGLVDKARITIESFTTDENMESLRGMLAGARGAMIIPQLLKAGFIIGGSGGSGVLVAHDRDSGAWSAPSFITMGSGSVGLQIGVEAQEIVLVIMTKKGIEAVIQHKFTLGAEASVSVGPIGGGIEAATTANLRADIYGFARSKGLFGGIALEGAVIESRDKWNQRYYGKPVTPKEIVIDRSISHQGGNALAAALVKAAKK